MVVTVTSRYLLCERAGNRLFLWHLICRTVENDNDRELFSFKVLGFGKVQLVLELALADLFGRLFCFYSW